MSKKIVLVYKNKETEEEREYTLEYTRRVVESMEREGFRIDELGEKPMVLIPELFAGAFRAHHKFAKREIIDEIYKQTPNKDKLLETLIEMYNEPRNALMDEPEEEAEKNVSWGMSE